jgi:hypothetical protein
VKGIKLEKIKDEIIESLSLSLYPKGEAQIG